MITQINIKKITYILIGVIFVLGTAAFALAASDKKDKEEKADLNVSEIEGEVSAIDKHGIAVVYNRDIVRGSESEIYVPLTKENIRIIHKRQLEEIQVGDRVKVEYETVTDEQKHSSFNVKTITFLKPAQKKLLPPEPQEEEQQDPAEEEAAALPFKGIQ